MLILTSSLEGVGCALHHISHIEQIVSAEGVHVCRWLSVFNLLPRLLLLSTLHKRINMNRPHSSTYLLNSTTFKNPNIGGRRVGAPSDLAGDTFENRVRAFLNGRFWELLSTCIDVTSTRLTAPRLPARNQSHDLLDPPLTPSL